jgi:hypothetical protein
MNIKFLIFIIIIFDINQTRVSSTISRKKTIIDNHVWALKWFEKNKNEIFLISNQQLKFKLYQELVKYSKINQKTFDNILELILEMKNRDKLSLLERNMFKNKLYSIRLGK